MSGARVTGQRSMAAMDILTVKILRYGSSTPPLNKAGIHETLLLKDSFFEVFSSFKRTGGTIFLKLQISPMLS